MQNQNGLVWNSVVSRRNCIRSNYIFRSRSTSDRQCAESQDTRNGGYRQGCAFTRRRRICKGIRWDWRSLFTCGMIGSVPLKRARDTTPSANRGQVCPMWWRYGNRGIRESSDIMANKTNHRWAEVAEKIVRSPCVPNLEHLTFPGEWHETPELLKISCGTHHSRGKPTAECWRSVARELTGPSDLHVLARRDCVRRFFVVVLDIQNTRVPSESYLRRRPPMAAAPCARQQHRFEARADTQPTDV